MKSIINNSTEYDEPTTIYEKDKNTDAILYQTNILGIDVVIAIGQNISKSKDAISAFPIYLVKQNKTVVPIGVFEYKHNTFPAKLNIDNLKDPPILYSKINHDFLNTNRLIPKKIETKTKTKTVKPETIEPETVNQGVLAEKINAGASQKYQEIMKDEKFTVIETSTNGDCFFDSICKALNSTEQEPKCTVSQLRQIVADEINDAVFDDIKFAHEINDADFDDIKFAHKVQGTKIEFQDHIKTSDFWAEDFAIQYVANNKNLNLIIVRIDESDSISVTCLTPYDPKNVTTNSFIILNYYQNKHYNLVAYNKKQLFKTADELPLQIQTLIVDFCMKGANTAFQKIPTLANLRASVKATAEDAAEDAADAAAAEDKTGGKQTQKGNQNKKVILVFHSKSSDNALPGKGPGEHMPPGGKNVEFTALSQIPNWRQKLSSSWVQSFTLDNKRWASVEHYYQACKFKRNNPSFYDNFSLDSETELSKDPKLAKSAGKQKATAAATSTAKKRTRNRRKTLSTRPSHIVQDSDFYKSERNKKVMHDAQKAKFAQNDDLSDLLKATGDATLMHHRTNHSPVEFKDLMQVRDMLI